jgi:hypothetical protein
MICEICSSSNWDGIVTGNYPHLVQYLEKEGIPVELNEKGFLRIP